MIMIKDYKINVILLCNDHIFGNFLQTVFVKQEQKHSDTICNYWLSDSSSWSDSIAHIGGNFANFERWQFLQCIFLPGSNIFVKPNFWDFQTKSRVFLMYLTVTNWLTVPVWIEPPGFSVAKRTDHLCWMKIKVLMFHQITNKSDWKYGVFKRTQGQKCYFFPLTCWLKEWYWNQFFQMW